MRFYRLILQVLRRALLYLLLAYWVVFGGYTLKYMVTGGLAAVIVWYRHISRAPFEWHWAAFLAGQILLLIVTVALYLRGRRTPQGG